MLFAEYSYNVVLQRRCHMDLILRQEADAIVCRAGNVDITATRMRSRRGEVAARADLTGRKAHELYATGSPQFSQPPDEPNRERTARAHLVCRLRKPYWSLYERMG